VSQNDSFFTPKDAGDTVTIAHDFFFTPKVNLLTQATQSQLHTLLKGAIQH